MDNTTNATWVRFLNFKDFERYIEENKSRLSHAARNKKTETGRMFGFLHFDLMMDGISRKMCVAVYSFTDKSKAINIMNTI